MKKISSFLHKSKMWRKLLHFLGKNLSNFAVLGAIIKTSFNEKKSMIQKYMTKLLYTNSNFYYPQRLDVNLSS